MSKDPAFLFYSSDFLTGTMLMTDEQVGKYIRLLCIQHQKGRLSEKDMLKICGSYDEDIFSKFHKDEAGLYYNERLEAEINRRLAYSESRRKNREKKNKDVKNICDSYEAHMENENENENINNNSKSKSKRFIKPTLEEVQAYCKERGNNVDPQQFIDHYDSNGWRVGRNPMKDWKAAVRTWERTSSQILPKPPPSPRPPEQSKYKGVTEVI
jgi:uncharacterized protein YdaU (DUF1376 family)